MRYWVYINDKVDGPYEEEKLADLAGFTPDTLICSEEIEEGGGQEWVKASNIFEFDEASKTMTRAPLTQEELAYIHGNASAQQPEEKEHAVSSAPAVDTSAAQILIEKIDHLTQEIESLKGKLDAALAVSASSPVSAPAPDLSTQAAPVTEDKAVSNTDSLIKHAENLVHQAEAENETKPVDFLDEIQIGAAKTETMPEKGGEEVVLRSALDSLYNAKLHEEQTEAEKEITFQDLLSPLKTAEHAPQEQEQPQPAAQEAGLSALPKTETEEKAPKEQPAPITEAKREEIINEITAPAHQDNLILQAVEEAQKEEQPKADLASLDAVATEPAPVEQPAAEEGLQLQMPSAQAKNEDPAPQTHAEKESLDLADQPQLSIAGDEPAQPVQPQQQPQTEQAQNISAPISDQLTPMNPADDLAPEQKEITETVKELVPGKKIEPEQEEEGLISQADLDEAFTERPPEQEFPIPAEEPKPVDINEEAEIESVQQSEESLPEGKGFYNPNDMTEVELKAGSTYLISDFIPPAINDNNKSAAQGHNASYGAVPGSSEAAQAEADGTSGLQVQSVGEAVEEIIPGKKTDQADLTMSKVILENTIKTKRGATMDIKTVPMVNEPGESDRLDLSESDLDINTQHDMKAADIKPGGNKLTKMVLGSVVSIVILALIYVMLAYLELLPQQFNFLQATPAAEQIQVQDQQLNELLDPNSASGQTQLPSDSAAQNYPGQQGYAPANGQTQQPVLPQQVAANGAFLPQGQTAPALPQANPLDPILTEVKNLQMANGQTLEQLINSRHPVAQGQIEWSITTAVEPNNYSILVKVPPENPQSFKISHRFNYNTVTKVLSPTISDSKNLLDSITPQPQATR